MTYVWYVEFFARKVNSFDGRNYKMFIQSDSDELWKTLLPLYQTVEHIQVRKSEIICSFSVDTPLEF